MASTDSTTLPALERRTNSRKSSSSSSASTLSASSSNIAKKMTPVTIAWSTGADALVTAKDNNDNNAMSVSVSESDLLPPPPAYDEVTGSDCSKYSAAASHATLAAQKQKHTKAAAALVAASSSTGPATTTSSKSDKAFLAAAGATVPPHRSRSMRSTSSQVTSSSSTISTSPSYVYLRERLFHYKRRTTCLTICILILLLFVVALAVLAALAWRAYHQQVYSGSCDFRFSPLQQLQQQRQLLQQQSEHPPLFFVLSTNDAASPPLGSSLADDVRVNDKLMQQFNVDNMNNITDLLPKDVELLEREALPSNNKTNRMTDSLMPPMFREDFALDMMNSLWAMLTTPKLPDVANGHAARFIHDFNKNLTAILDMEQYKCYVMPLDRDLVMPPRDLFDFFSSMRTGKYDLDTSRIERTYFVDPMPILDTTQIGPYISEQCMGLPAFWLREKQQQSNDTTANSKEALPTKPLRRERLVELPLTTLSSGSSGFFGSDNGGSNFSPLFSSSSSSLLNSLFHNMPSPPSFMHMSSYMPPPPMPPPSIMSFMNNNNMNMMNGGGGMNDLNSWNRFVNRRRRRRRSAVQRPRVFTVAQAVPAAQAGAAALVTMHIVE